MAGRVELISGGVSAESPKRNRHLYSPYLSAAAMSDPHVQPVFALLDDVMIRLTPASWIAWDMAVLDAQALGGDWAETRDTCSRWIEGDCSQFGC